MLTKWRESCINVSRFQTLLTHSAVMTARNNLATTEKRALFDHLENVEEDTGEQIELDVIGLCCDYEEATVDDLINGCDLDTSKCEDDDDRQELVEKFLNKHTTIIWQRGDTFLYQQF